MSTFGETLEMKMRVLLVRYRKEVVSTFGETLERKMRVLLARHQKGRCEYFW